MINETWLNHQKEFSLQNKQYSIIRGDDGTVTARGVAIVYRSSFKVFASNIIPKHLLSLPNIAILKLLLENNGSHLFILTFYGSTEDILALQGVEQILKYIDENYVQWNLIIYSDLNFDIRFEKIKLKTQWVRLKKFLWNFC